MNEIINRFFLAGDKLQPEKHLRQPWFPYSAYGAFTKNKERTQKLKKRGSKYIYQKQLDKACFRHDKAHKVLKIYGEEQLIRYHVIKLLVLLKDDAYHRCLVAVVSKYFIKVVLLVLLHQQKYLILKRKLCHTNTNQFIKELKNEKHSHFIRTIFGVLILQLCN